MTAPMEYKQGRTFPPSAHGVGLIFVFMACFLVYVLNGHYWILSFSYISLWIMFSTTKIDMTQVNSGFIIKKYGFFPLKFRSKINLKDFDAGVIKQVNVKYSTTQSTGYFVISSQENTDSYMALQLKLKGKYEFETLFKGTRAEIIDFIKSNLTGSKLKYYNAIPKVEYEIKIE
jgi:hypothetical protein